MRHSNRLKDEIREIEIIPNFNPYAEGSCLIKCGGTHVVCTASVEEKVPAWLKGQNKGWITAEYAMLPRATQVRVPREAKKPSGRTQEIQRLIGRSLRAVVDLEKMKDLSICIDCDVIQADGRHAHGFDYRRVCGAVSVHSPAAAGKETEDKSDTRICGGDFLRHS